MIYTEKYRPSTLHGVVGQQHHAAYLKEWAEAWESGFNIEKKAIILYGQAGIGKTSLAHALAKEMKWDIVELNASDQRTAGIINRVAGSASKTGTFDGIDSKKLIILDEADSLHGGRDRGGSKAIINLIKNTSQPIILIMNNFYKLDVSLRSICKSLQFNKVNSSVVVKLLKKICEKENIDVENKVVENIAQMCDGDVRAALNDLESICVGKNVVNVNDIIDNNSKRDVSETIFTFVDKVLKGKNIKEVIELSGSINENPENTVYWLDENIPFVYKNTDELYGAYDLLSKADIFLGRVHKRQNYTMWKYANTLICGVNTVGGSRSGFVKYSPPKYWSKLKQSKPNRNIKKSIANKVGKFCHISTNKVLSEMFWFIKKLINNDEYSIIVSYELDLTKDEIAYLLDCMPNSKKVIEIYDIILSLKENNELENIDSQLIDNSDDVKVDNTSSKSQMVLDDF